MDKYEVMKRIIENTLEMYLSNSSELHYDAYSIDSIKVNEESCAIEFKTSAIKWKTLEFDKVAGIVTLFGSVFVTKINNEFLDKAIKIF